ncbi:hypothetical protein [Pseudarthrobacter sp. MEB009]|uniref:hypothetical protein n=1 Tax=Pseudarthrobacter sp. MEB009 TaxID=3040326 RepID=UPI0025555AEC|nr:hypothetical protein [Pseudarthrobacter sp. MEB009]
MEVTLTIANPDGTQEAFTGTGPDYDTAKAAAAGQVPDGAKALSIRTNPYAG